MKMEYISKLKKLGVSVVYLFGSAYKGRRSPISDIDIGIVLSDEKLLENTRKTYMKLYEIFSGIYPSFHIDIVFLQSAPISLQYDAIKNGKVIFEMNPVLRANYEEKVIKMYIDFMPFLKVFDDAAAARY